MKDVKHIHRQAIEKSDLALVERMRGNEQAAADYFQSAFELESEAAQALLNEPSKEPTRSVLFRSAATLARDCGRFPEAEKLIYQALAGEPPPEIATELKDLLEQVTFQRHLELRGVQLAEEEIQMAISGNAVGSGMAPTEALLGRVQSTEALLYRTAERRLNRPYRDRGRPERKLSQDMQLYISQPRAASFAVTFRVGGLQQSLPGLSPSEAIIDELLDCLQLYVCGKEEQLRERIKEEAYYLNFVGLARNLQPDGSRVNLVGFTCVRRGVTKQVAMTRAARDTLSLTAREILATADKGRKQDTELVQLRGELMIANATKRSEKQSGEIAIVMPGNARARVIVPAGMMSDIVKPLWEAEVEVTGIRKGKKVHLMQIRPVAIEEEAVLTDKL